MANGASGPGDNQVMTKKVAATLLGALAATALPLIATPVAQADICGDVGGRHAGVGGCVNIGGDIADAAVAGAAVADVAHPYGWGVPPVEGWPPLPVGYLAWPSFPGEAPCYTPAGQPYYTPGAEPCYPA